jgi:hypothetical protein
MIIVSYTKHWDNDTKGTIEVEGNDIVKGLHHAERVLQDEIFDEDVLGQFEDLYTITKAEVGESSNWTGVPS